MSGHDADFGVIDGIARTLRNASSDLDKVGNSILATPDAGRRRRDACARGDPRSAQ